MGGAGLFGMTLADFFQAKDQAAIAAAMTHVDDSREPRLERIMSEIRTHRKRVLAGR